MTAELTFPVEATGTTAILRRPTTTDVDRTTDICQDPTIQRFTSVPVPFTRRDAARFVDLVNARWDDGHPDNRVVVVGDVVVANVALVHVDEEDRWAEVGYWAAPDIRRQGITTAAVRRMCRWAIDDLQLERLELQTAAGTKAPKQWPPGSGLRGRGPQVSRSTSRCRWHAGGAHRHDGLGVAARRVGLTDEHHSGAANRRWPRGAI
jgi:RimJ/RimL family protein N-acetyltransferase